MATTKDDEGNLPSRRVGRCGYAPGVNSEDPDKVDEEGRTRKPDVRRRGGTTCGRIRTDNDGIWAKLGSKISPEA